MTTTSCAASMSASTTCEPMNPAPPLTTTFMAGTAASTAVTMTSSERTQRSLAQHGHDLSFSNS